jgi:hypothetical protein
MMDAALAGLSSPPDMMQGYPDGHRTRELTKRAGWCLGPQKMSEAGTFDACVKWNHYNTPPLDEEKFAARLRVSLGARLGDESRLRRQQVV